MWGKDSITKGQLNFKEFSSKVTISDSIETEINEEDDESHISYTSRKFDTISSNAHERLLTYESTHEIPKLKLSTELSNVSSIKRTTTYWLKDKIYTARNQHSNERKELMKKIKHLQRILTEKKDCLKEKINQYDIVKQSNNNMKKMITVTISTLNKV